MTDTSKRGAICGALLVLLAVLCGCRQREVSEQATTFYLPLSLRARGVEMANWYVDSTVPGPGSGTLLDPWDDLTSNVNSKGNNNTFYLRGGVVAQVYDEAEVNITADNITIEPYQAELVEFRASGVGDYIFDIHGDDCTINGKGQLDINKNHVPGACIYVREGADDCTINDSEIRGARGVGGMIRVRGHRFTLDGCEIHDTFNTNTTDSACVSHQKGEDLTIRDCVIYDASGDGLIVDDTYTPGPFFIYDTEFYTTLANCSENGIDVKVNGDGSVQSIISGCTFHDFQACTGTCGGSGDPQGEALGLRNSCTNVLIENCLIYNCTSGILLDDGTSDYIVRQCVVRDMKTAAADPNASTLSALFLRANDVEVYNCTFDDCPEESIRMMVPLSGVTIQNCIFNDCGTIVGDGLPGYSADYNCWWGCTDTLPGVHDVLADPLFTNEAANDFTLTAASPCIDAGTNKGLPYYGSAPDIGRYEYQPPGPGGSTVYVVIVVVAATVVVLESS